MRIKNLGKSGYSMVQAFFVLGATVLVGAAVYQAIQSSKQTMSTTKRAGDSGTLIDMALGSGRSLLENSGPNKTNGICRVFSTQMQSGGNGIIYLHLPDASQSPFDADWTRAFDASQWQSSPQWTDSKGNITCSSSGYQRCYQPLSALGVTDDFLAKQPHLTVTLIPVNLRPNSGQAINAATLPSSGFLDLNARDSGFVISVKVEFTNKETGVLSSTSNYSTLWAGQMTCNYATPSGVISLNPSSIGTGTVNNASGGSNPTLFSSGIVQSRSPSDILNISFSQYENTKNKIVNGKVVSDYSTSTCSSDCREQTFRCSQVSGTRTWLNTSLVVETSVLYLPNTLLSSNNLIARPELSFEKVDPANPSARTSIVPQTTYQLFGQALPANGTVTYSSNESLLTMTAQNSNDTCNQICTAPAYNGTEPAFHPALKNYSGFDTLLYGSNGPQPYIDPQSATACGCCAVKECGRSGLNTRMNCAQMPVEPLDSRLTECEGNIDSKVYSNTDIVSTISTAGMSPNACITANAASIGGGAATQLTFQSQDCNQVLPSLCYFQGKFGVGGTLSTKTVTQNFFGSRAACYGMSDEMLSKADVDAQLGIQGNSAEGNVLATTLQGSNYHFFNAGSAGQFIAPQTDSQASSAANAMNAAAVNSAWVGLRTDAATEIYAAPPELESSFLGSIVYWHEAGNFLHFASDPDHGVPAGTNMILFHSRRYFGPMAVGQPSKNIPAICRRTADGTLFLSAGTSNSPDQAKQICYNEGGVFLGPMKPMEWERALLLLAAPDASLPWPTPSNGIAMAWVGFRKSGSDWRVYIAPPTGSTLRVNWRGEASASAAPANYRLCRNMTTKALELNVGPSHTCSANTGFDFFGAPDETQIVWMHRLMLFLAQKKADGTLQDSDIIDLVAN